LWRGRIAAWLVLIISGLAILGTAWFAFLHGRRIAQALQQLNDSTTRMSTGDFTQPVRTLRRDELGDLQARSTACASACARPPSPSDYLDSVLGSMTDAVFVASARTASIKVANFAALRLLGFARRAGRQAHRGSLLDESERAGFDPAARLERHARGAGAHRQGQTIPVSLSGSPIANDDPQFQGVIFVARNITDRKRAERRIRYLARYDALTKIPNRMQFQHLLQQAIARRRANGTGVALLYLDMDRFKEVNDTFGHCRRRPRARGAHRAPDAHRCRGGRARPPRRRRVRAVHRRPAAEADNRGAIAHLARSILDEVGAAFHVGAAGGVPDREHRHRAVSRATPRTSST
jgi:PAS domain S-box-containing protein